MSAAARRAAEGEGVGGSSGAPAVLVAPDSFKGTFTASEVSEAIARGVEAAGASADRCPLADGGEGTMAVLLEALGGRAEGFEVSDPLGRPVRAELGLLEDGATAIVEMAAASGLALVAEHERDAELAGTYGTGELIAAAVRAGASRVLVAVGGSATTDGGAGCLEAIEAAGGLGGARLTVLCDVTVPWERAPAVFGPQKGAGPEAVARLERRLDRLAAELPRDPRGVPRTGAAGGLSGGLWAAHGAELVSGAEWVLDAVGIEARAERAAALVTGEGRIDSQTSEGKLIEVLLRRTAGLVPVRIAAVGRDDLGERGARELGLDRVVEAGDPEAMARVGALAASLARG